MQLFILKFAYFINLSEKVTLNVNTHVSNCNYEIVFVFDSFLIFLTPCAHYVITLPYYIN